MRQEIDAQTRLLSLSMIGAAFTAVRLAFAAARLALPYDGHRTRR